MISEYGRDMHMRRNEELDNKKNYKESERDDLRYRDPRLPGQSRRAFQVGSVILYRQRGRRLEERRYVGVERRQCCFVRRQKPIKAGLSWPS